MIINKIIFFFFFFLLDLNEIQACSWKVSWNFHIDLKMFSALSSIVCVWCGTPGSRLLSADGDGQIKCWGMTEHLVNSWECTQSSSVEGDPIVSLSWLHNGVKLALHVEKVRKSPYCLLTNGWKHTVTNTLMFLFLFSLALRTLERSFPGLNSPPLSRCLVGNPWRVG